MAICAIATLKIAQGRNAEFEAVFDQLVKAVRAGEPGNTLYQLFKSRDDASTYVVLEIYKDAAAQQAHRNSDHFRAAGPKLAPLLSAPPDVKSFDSV